jgi:hypothetical protein
LGFKPDERKLQSGYPVEGNMLMEKVTPEAPVPVRLSCRYSNGLVISYVARAVAYDDSSLRVLSSEYFERGIKLSIMAPFLPGVVACRVAATARNREQPAYFELDLQFLNKQAPVVEERQKVLVIAAPQLLVDEVAEAARELASRLESGYALPFPAVLQEISPSQRQLFLAVGAAAVALLLQDKGTLDLRYLIESTRGGSGS